MVHFMENGIHLNFVHENIVNWLAAGTSKNKYYIMVKLLYNISVQLIVFLSLEEYVIKSIVK